MVASSANPWRKHNCVTASASIFAAAIAAVVGVGTAPLVGYLLTPMFIHDPSEHDLFLAACCVTGITLFSLGAAKARFVQQKALKLGAETRARGALCASVAYFCGAALSSQLPSH